MIQHLLCCALEKNDNDAWPVATLTKIMTLMTMVEDDNDCNDDDDCNDEDEGDCVTDRWHSRSSGGMSQAQHNPRPDMKPVFRFKEFSLGDH